MRLPLFRKHITLSGIVKLVLALTFAAISAVIIIPNIDYQEWFPQQLGTYDFTPSIDFNTHTKAVLDLSGSSYEEWEIRKLMTRLHTRMNAAGITESQFDFSPGEELVIRLPESFEEAHVYALTTKGEIEFKAPKPDINFEEDPMLLFDPESFEPSDLKYSDITSAVISQVTDQFTYIDITLKDDAVERWADYSVEHPSGNFGLTIDGMVYQSWLMPGNPAQNTNPNIIITEPEPKSLIVYSYIADGPLQTDTFYPTVEKEEPVYGDQEIIRVALGLLIFSGVGLLLRFFAFKENIVQVIATGFIIAGAVAIAKIVSFPLSIAFFVGMAILLMLILFTPSRYHLGILSMIGGISIPMILCASAVMQTIGSLFIVFSVFGLLSIFFLIFFDAYAD